MIIGVPKEIKVHEYRVGMVPAPSMKLSLMAILCMLKRKQVKGSALAIKITLLLGRRFCLPPKPCSRSRI